MLHLSKKQDAILHMTMPLHTSLRWLEQIDKENKPLPFSLVKFGEVSISVKTLTIPVFFISIVILTVIYEVSSS